MDKHFKNKIEAVEKVAKWNWMMDYCKKRKLAPAKKDVWEEAEKAYYKSKIEGDYSPQEGGCWICWTKEDDENNPLMFSSEFDCYIHKECLEQELREDTYDEAIKIMAREFGYNTEEELLNIIEELINTLPNERTDYSGVGWCSGCNALLWCSGNPGPRDPCKPNCILQKARNLIKEWRKEIK